MNKKMIFLIVFISLITVSSSFALSDNVTYDINSSNVENYDVNIDNSKIINDESINKVSDFSINQKLIFNDESSQLYRTYKEHNLDVICNLSNAAFLVCSDGVIDVYSDSKLNIHDYDVLVVNLFAKGYFIFTNCDMIDYDSSLLVPIYILGDKIYADYGDESIVPDFKGYAVPSSIGVRNILRNYTNSTSPRIWMWADNVDAEGNFVFECLELEGQYKYEPVNKPYKFEPYVFESSPLYEDYMNGFEGFVCSVDKIRYLNYGTREGQCNYAPTWPQESPENPEDICNYDMLYFYYGKESRPNSSLGFTILNKYNSGYYGIHTNTSCINMELSKIIPVYIYNNGLYVGKANGITPDFEGFASPEVPLYGGLGGPEGKLFDYSFKNQNLSATADIGGSNDYSIQNNETQDHSQQKSATMPETGNPFAILLIGLIFSIIGFKRKN